MIGLDELFALYLKQHNDEIENNYFDVGQCNRVRENMYCGDAFDGRLKRDFASNLEITGAKWEIAAFVMEYLELEEYTTYECMDSLEVANDDCGIIYVTPKASGSFLFADDYIVNRFVVMENEEIFAIVVNENKKSEIVAYIKVC